MRLIRGADVAHVRIVGKVIFAIGKLQAALQDVGGIVPGIVEAGSHPKSKEMRSVEVGVIQRVDIGAQRRSQSSGQFLLVLDGGDSLEVRFERRHSFGFDARLIHVRVVEVANLAWARSRRSTAFGALFDQRGGALVALVGEGREYANPAAVRRNFGTLDPCSVRVFVEVIARLDRRVHVGDHNAVRGRLRGVLRKSSKREAEAESANSQARRFQDQVQKFQ